MPYYQKAIFLFLATVVFTSQAYAAEFFYEKVGDCTLIYKKNDDGDCGEFFAAIGDCDKVYKVTQANLSPKGSVALPKDVKVVQYKNNPSNTNLASDQVKLQSKKTDYNKEAINVSSNMVTFLGTNKRKDGSRYMSTPRDSKLAQAILAEYPMANLKRILLIPKK